MRAQTEAERRDADAREDEQFEELLAELDAEDSAAPELPSDWRPPAKHNSIISTAGTDLNAAREAYVHLLGDPDVAPADLAAADKEFTAAFWRLTEARRARDRDNLATWDLERHCAEQEREDGQYIDDAGDDMTALYEGVWRPDDYWADEVKRAAGRVSGTQVVYNGMIEDGVPPDHRVMVSCRRELRAAKEASANLKMIRKNHACAKKVWLKGNAEQGASILHEFGPRDEPLRKGTEDETVPRWPLFVLLAIMAILIWFHQSGAFE